MGLWDTFRAIRAARRQHLPESAEAAGDEGERLALETVERLIRRRAAALGCRCYPALRVPRPGGGGKYEIDLLVASPFGVAGLEVKHWGGEVELVRSGTWLQLARHGDSREYDDPLALVREKMLAVHKYLLTQNVAVPIEALPSAVVLTNPRLKLGPRLAQTRGAGTTGRAGGVPDPVGQSAGFRLLGGPGPAAGSGPDSPPALPRLRRGDRALDRLPTWDLIGLYGGKVIKGDIANVGIALTQGRHLTRRDAGMVQFHLPRSWLFGWFATPCVSWTDAHGAPHSEPLQLGATVTIRPAGHRNDVVIPVEHILAVRFGYRDHAYAQAAKPPLESYKPGTVYQGTVAGVQDFGIFVNLDGHRDGLVHISKLPGRGLAAFQRGQPVTVRVVRTEVPRRQGED